MLLMLFLLICFAFFPMQLFLCFHSKKNIIKMMPLLLIIGFIAGCCIAALPGLSWMPEDGRLAAIVLLFIGLFVLAADGLAWLIFGVVKLVQIIEK